MLTDVQHINLGLSKIAANRITRIDPAVTPLERYMADNYEHWKRRELAKRRWVFALEEHYKLTLETQISNVPKPYKFRLPNDCLRPVRDKCTEWQQRGRYIRSDYPEIYLTYIRDVPEADFDPLFSEVLACAIAVESCEYVTQSTTKKEVAVTMYREALMDAGKGNAFVIGPESIEGPDQSFSWEMARDG